MAHLIPLHDFVAGGALVALPIQQRCLFIIDAAAIGHEVDAKHGMGQRRRRLALCSSISINVLRQGMPQARCSRSCSGVMPRTVVTAPMCSCGDLRLFPDVGWGR